MYMVAPVFDTDTTLQVALASTALFPQPDIILAITVGDSEKATGNVICACLKYPFTLEVEQLCFQHIFNPPDNEIYSPLVTDVGVKLLFLSIRFAKIHFLF